MRIITGSARGTRLVTAEGENTRPTSDKVKEAVFSMIQFDIEGRRVLDLFAGSGQMAFEALSRGAERAVLVDSSKEAVACIEENAKKTHLGGRCRIVGNTYTSYLRSAAGRESFDLIFLDPPYNSGMLPKALKTIAAEGFAAPGSTLVCETDCDIPPKATRIRKDEEVAAEAILRDVFGGDKELAARYAVLKSPLYGRTRITLLTPRTDSAESGETDEAETQAEDGE
ncbi:MAG: 16S rRNA (guanine(966)-N(2))-methyltransferase RsmD [Ruminococcaceae bacterium]|jgi:16S rRNA (guanine(966)-N(2))-methyltransferase RsmD|nr:16S rRNA (guanine(966)-N(2))-methyltransferase RsmD [Oscillospiraceae bacterium]